MSWNLNVIDWEALSALGTFLAVIVSLMLARSNHKEKIKIYANYDHGALDSVYGLLVFIKIQNISHNDVYIEEVRFEVLETLTTIKEKIKCEISIGEYTKKDLILKPSILLKYIRSLYLSRLENSYIKLDQVIFKSYLLNDELNERGRYYRFAISEYLYKYSKVFEYLEKNDLSPSENIY